MRGQNQAAPAWLSGAAVELARGQHDVFDSVQRSRAGPYVALVLFTALRPIAGCRASVTLHHIAAAGQGAGERASAVAILLRLRPLYSRSSSLGKLDVPNE